MSQFSSEISFAPGEKKESAYRERKSNRERWRGGESERWRERPNVLEKCLALYIDVRSQTQKVCAVHN